MFKKYTIFILLFWIGCAVNNNNYYYSLYDDFSWSLKNPRYDSRDEFKQALEDLGLNKDGELFEDLDFKEIEVIYSISKAIDRGGIIEWEEEDKKILVKSEKVLTEFEILFQIQLVLNSETSDILLDHHFFEELYLIEESIKDDILQYRIFLGS